MNQFNAAHPPPYRSFRGVTRGGTALAALGILAVAATITSAIVWSMHLTAESSDVPAYSRRVASAKTATDAPATRNEREALLQLFGSAAAPGKDGSQTLDGLQLQGIVNDKRGTGIAIFSIDGAAPVRVRAGGQVRDGIRLAEVQSKQVVLERGGQRVELALVKRPAPPDTNADSRPRGVPASPQAKPATAPGAPSAVPQPPR